MDVHIGEVNTSVSATDSESLLNPRLLRRIVTAVLAELREQQAYEQRQQQERCLQPGITRPNEQKGERCR